MVDGRTFPSPLQESGKQTRSRKLLFSSKVRVFSAWRNLKGYSRAIKRKILLSEVGKVLMFCSLINFAVISRFVVPHVGDPYEYGGANCILCSG